MGPGGRGRIGSSGAIPAWADLSGRLSREVQRWRSAGAVDSEFKGLFIDLAEVETDLGDLEAEDSGVVASPFRYAPVLPDRLERLKERFGLSELEVRVLLACVAPDLDLRYERIYAYLQDDVNRKRPTVDFMLRLLCDDAGDRAGARTLFHPDSALLRFGLIRVGDGHVLTPLLASPLWPEERVVASLLGSDQLDQRLVVGIGRRFGGRPAAEPGGTALGRLAILTGPPGSGKEATAASLAAKGGLGLLVIDSARLLRSSLQPEEAVSAILREAALNGDAVYWSAADMLWGSEPRALSFKDAIVDALDRWDVPMFLGGNETWDAPATLPGTEPLRLRLSMPNGAKRLELWTALIGHGTPMTDSLREGLPALAMSFRLTPGLMSDALAVARGLVASRGGPDAAGLNLEDLYAGSRAVSRRRLADLAQEITPSATWEDIALPDDSLQELQELCSNIRHRSEVLDTWGFADRLTTGSGTTALFAGPSGTGKTMAAGIVAGELGLPLFKVDLAGIVSKWIGETEKNLDRVFDAAEGSNAILFFDEADALFGKRSEVKDSHDRYANLEISYLLQKMETYDGVAILATNMRQQLDEAFLRRLTFLVSFPLPGEADRARIWERVWPERLPLHSDLELTSLARITLAGGNIKNVALAAAYLAVAERQPVGRRHLLQALRREYQKLGKAVSVEELERETRG